jgi:hypothetical protein
VYLKQQKRLQRNTYLIIYTNNTHPNWTRYIQSYIEYKLGKEEEATQEETNTSSSSSSFFDKIIDSQKHNACRQHQRKHLDDLFRCIDYSSNSSICYIDNEYHPGMKSRQTHYCKLSSYVHNLSITIIADRLQSSGLLEIIIPGIHSTVFTNIYLHYCENKYTKSLSEAEYRYEVRTSQELMLKIRIFFMNSTTHKRRHTYSSFRSDHDLTASAGGVSPSVGSSPRSTDLILQGRKSETTLTRVTDPLFNYYHNLPMSRRSHGLASSLSERSSNNKTRKNRRVI